MADDAYMVSRNGILITMGVTVVVAVIGVVAAPNATVQILGFCSMIWVSLFGLLRLEANTQANEAATAKIAASVASNTGRIEDTTSAMNGSLAHIEKVTADTHTLVNSNMGIQLALNAELSAWKAHQTKDPQDIMAADAAKQTLADHRAKQAIVDTRNAKPPETSARPGATDAPKPSPNTPQEKKS